MKKKKNILSIVLTTFLFAVIINSCAPTSKITDKSGAQLWGENCMRCHNAPSPADYSDTQWETIGMHMKLRANISDVEREKIVAFLQSAN